MISERPFTKSNKAEMLFSKTLQNSCSQRVSQSNFEIHYSVVSVADFQQLNFGWEFCWISFREFIPDYSLNISHIPYGKVVS